MPGDRPTGFFDQGALAFTSGANAGRQSEVLRHTRDDDGDISSCGSRWRSAIEVGDAFTVSAGCDKRFSTCRDRFDNAVNFRGFPQMPGNDFALSYPAPGSGNDGREPVE